MPFLLSPRDMNSADNLAATLVNIIHNVKQTGRISLAVEEHAEETNIPLIDLSTMTREEAALYVDLD